MLELLLIHPQLCGKRWLIESWYKSAVPWVSRVTALVAPSQQWLHSNQRRQPQKLVVVQLLTLWCQTDLDYSYKLTVKPLL